MGSRGGFTRGFMGFGLLKKSHEPGYPTDGVVVLRAPDLLQADNVVVGGCEVLGDGREPDCPVSGHSHPNTPTVEAEHRDGDHLQ